MDALSKTSSLFPLFSVIASLMPILALQCHPGLCGQFLILDTCIASGLGDAIYCENETLYLAILSGSYKVLKLDYSKRLLVLENPTHNHQSSCYNNTLGNLILINSTSPLHVCNYPGSSSQTLCIQVCPSQANATACRPNITCRASEECLAAINEFPTNSQICCGSPKTSTSTSCKVYSATWINSSSSQFNLTWSLLSPNGSDCCSLPCGESCRLDCKGQPVCFPQGRQMNSSKVDCGEKRNSKSHSKVLLIGVAVGAVTFVGASFLAIIICLYRRKMQFWKVLSTRNISLQNNDLSNFLSNKRGSPSATTLFSYKELEVATESFAESKLLGDGGFGIVYKGTLTDGRVVAVKKLNKKNKQGAQQFYNEVMILSQIRHKNLVQLLGCCLEESELMLVYEFVPNGPLAEHIHGFKGKHLCWETRLTVALETAQALAYLHCSVDPPILHRDVKSSNILLDENFRVKVADFGLSKLMHGHANYILTAPQGTPGYLDPDYYESYQLTDKSDVYSFGVVLMELISAKRAVDVTRGRREINLASMAVSKIQCGSLEDLIDPELEIESRPDVREEVSRVAELAFQCLASQRDDRPSMREVAQELQSIRSSRSIMHMCLYDSMQSKELANMVTTTCTKSSSSIQSSLSTSTSSHHSEVEA